MPDIVEFLKEHDAYDEWAEHVEEEWGSVAYFVANVDQLRPALAIQGAFPWPAERFNYWSGLNRLWLLEVNNEHE